MKMGFSECELTNTTTLDDNKNASSQLTYATSKTHFNVTQMKQRICSELLNPLLYPLINI